MSALFVCLFPWLCANMCLFVCARVCASYCAFVAWAALWGGRRPELRRRLQLKRVVCVRFAKARALLWLIWVAVLLADVMGWRVCFVRFSFLSISRVQTQDDEAHVYHCDPRMQPPSSLLAGCASFVSSFAMPV